MASVLSVSGLSQLPFLCLRPSGHRLKSTHLNAGPSCWALNSALHKPFICDSPLNCKVFGQIYPCMACRGSGVRVSLAPLRSHSSSQGDECILQVCFPHRVCLPCMHYPWWLHSCFNPLATACRVLMSMIGPRFDRNERESFIGVPTRTGRIHT